MTIFVKNYKLETVLYVIVYDIPIKKLSKGNLRCGDEFCKYYISFNVCNKTMEL